MIKRLTWFVGGAVAGAVGAGAAKRKVKAAAAELTPVQVARRTGDRVRRKGQDVAAAVREGRRAAQVKEAELRGRLDGRLTRLDDDGDVDAVIVDGREVEPGQVIVLRQVRDDAGRRRRRGA